MKEYKFLEIENLQLPESRRVQRSRMRSILDAIACMVSEYAVGCLGFDASDETLYPFIRKYFMGECETKELLKRLISNFEIEEMFSFLPGLEISFDDPCWKDALEKITVRSDAENTFSMGEKQFSCKKLFFHIAVFEGKPRAQRYFAEPGTDEPVFADLEDDSITTVINRPYRFTDLSVSPKEDETFQIEDEAFFDIEEIKSSDEDQRKAIRASVEHNLVVLAGAGSGKTRTLVSRLAYLHLVRGIPLSKIVLLTFTTSAAEEMRQRAEHLIAQIYQLKGVQRQPYVYAKTFDAFFRRILLDYFGEIGFTTQPVLDLTASRDKKCSLLKDVIEEYQLQRVFSNYRTDAQGLDTLLTQLEAYASGLTVNQPGLNRLLELFLDKQVSKNQVLGFQYVNLLVKRSLYQEDSPLKAALLIRYNCFLIDEFQDISSLQNETMRPFYNTSTHFTFVGDDDQSIYAWRGADVSIIRDIVNQENTDTQYLLINYRNNPNIVKAGNCILRLISNRAKHKEIIPYKTSGAKICVSTNDPKFVNVVDEIDRLIKSGIDPKEISVLARKSRQAKGIEDALRSIGIPVISKKEPPKLDSYYYLLKTMINIHSEYDLYHSCQLIMRFAKESDFPEKTIKKIIKGEEPAKGNLNVLQNIAMDAFRPGADQLSVIVERFAQKAGEEFAGLPNGRIESDAIDAFIDFLKDGELPWPITQKRLASAYAAFENVRDFKNMTRKTENGVSVNTIHQAKGLEYNIVMIVGLDQGEYPDIGIIDNEYNKKIQELESLKAARAEYFELKKTITDEQIQTLLKDCNHPSLSPEETESLSPLRSVIEKNLRGLKNLSANAIEDYLDEFDNCIAPLDRRYRFDQSKLTRKILELESLLAQRNEEIKLLDEEETVAAEEMKSEILQLGEQIKEAKTTLTTLQHQHSLFRSSIRNLQSFHTNAFIAGGLLTDMSRAEEIGAIKKQLEQERKVKIEEERRTFYVAVTRARDQLYLFTDEGATESEFVKEISDDLKTEFLVMTKNARAELERMAGGLRKEFEKETIDDDSIDGKIHSIIDDSQFKVTIDERFNEYLKQHPEYASLPAPAMRYFKQGMNLLFVGEMTGMLFVTEFSHNMQRAAEQILKSAAGKNAIPFETKDRQMQKLIIDKIRKETRSLNAQTPSRHFIEEIISSEAEGSRMDSLKKAAIQHYIVRSHLFKVKKEIYPTWACQRINIQPKQFLKAALDLSNMRNVLVHQNEDSWPEDPITEMLLDLRTIAEAGF
ncbi:MAG: UvrD-helicase domain-containing protein [Lachnospiraceae bacterium]|nr:UvrD-helicase domain-containing protein [Lachnospiraceae bacterium]